MVGSQFIINLLFTKMPRRKCTQKQLEALRRGREKHAHKRSKKTTNYRFGAAARQTNAKLSKISFPGVGVNNLRPII